MPTGVYDRSALTYNNWTPERVATLRRAAAERRCASEIAAELGGITRSAVIAKMRRIGIPALPMEERRERLSQGGRRGGKTRAAQMWGKDRPLPAPKPVPQPKRHVRKPPVHFAKPAPPPRITRDDPASRIVLALLAQADAAQQRRDGYRRSR